ncbi:MAG: hypothetical protein ABJ215_03130 [Alphaproteobacteria bacterium]
MSDPLLVRKGAAVPAATHPGDAARFHARRTILLPAINLHMTVPQSAANIARSRLQPPRAARLTGPAATEKRKFTFRIDTTRHSAFCRAAEARNVSRQRLLTEALDALLARTGHTPAQAPPQSAGQPNGTHHACAGAPPVYADSATRRPLL